MVNNFGTLVIRIYPCLNYYVEYAAYKNKPNMENLILEPTNNTPTVIFDKEGKLLMEGRSLPENTAKFFMPLIEWGADLAGEEVKLVINLEYLNSSSTKKLLELLKVLDANGKIRTLYIDWYYEVDDEDILENGQIFEEILRKAQFRYHEYSRAA